MLIVKYNIVAFVLVIISSLLIEYKTPMDISIGNLLYLPMGAAIFSYLVYGFGVLPGLAVANTLIGYFIWGNWFGLGLTGFYAHVMVGSLAPIAAILTMRYFKLSKFYDDEDLNFRHVIFLVILTALINALLKFFIFMNALPEFHAPVQFILTHFVSNTLGGLVFIYGASRISNFLVKR